MEETERCKKITKDLEKEWSKVYKKLVMKLIISLRLSENLIYKTILQRNVVNVPKFKKNAVKPEEINLVFYIF